MGLSEFTLRIILLFVPGIISFMIIDRLTFHKETKIHQILINSLTLGCFCYSLYYLMIPFLEICLKTNLEFSFWEALTSNAMLEPKEIGIVTILSVPAGFIFAYFINQKWLSRFAHTFKISKRFGDIDVWSYIMNSETMDANFVVIRDTKNGLMYEGWIEEFSDSTEEHDELFISDVKVYTNSTGEELYGIPALYISRKREDLILEFPLLKSSKGKEKPKRKEE